MNFLIDANLPRHLVDLLRERGHQAIHIIELPDGSTSVDTTLLNYSDEHNCIITTKDSDFSASFWLKNRPNKLLLISTGNVQNADLEALLIANFDELIQGLTENRFVELTLKHIIIHM